MGSTLLTWDLVRVKSLILVAASTNVLYVVASIGADEAMMRLERMKSLAQSIKIYEKFADDRVPVSLIETPLLRFSDAARGHPDGTLWAWGGKGRPVVLLELFLNKRDGKRIWSLALHSLSSRPLVAEGIKESRWTPPAAELQLKQLPNAPEPARSKAARLRQMKSLARRFKVHQIWQSERSNLRMLTQPIRRYSDPQSGIVDGAMFVFVHGTNPEMMMLIELTTTKESDQTWRYDFVRQGHAEFHVQLDNEEVWKCDKVSSRNAKNPFWYFAIPISTSDNSN